MKKYFIAYKKQGKLFNVETGNYDIGICGYEAVPNECWDTAQGARKAISSRESSEIEICGEIETEWIVLGINRNEDGTYTLPKLSIWNQMLFYKKFPVKSTDKHYED